MTGAFSDTNLFQPSFRPGLAEGSRTDTFGSALWRSQAVAVGGTWVLSSTLVSEMRFGFARGNFFQTPPNFGSGCPEQLIGLKGGPTDESICGGIPVTNVTTAIERRIGRTRVEPARDHPEGVRRARPRQPASAHRRS